MGRFLLIIMAIILVTVLIVTVVAVLISHEKKIKELQQRLDDRNI